VRSRAEHARIEMSFGGSLMMTGNEKISFARRADSCGAFRRSRLAGRSATIPGGWTVHVRELHCYPFRGTRCTLDGPRLLFDGPKERPDGMRVCLNSNITRLDDINSFQMDCACLWMNPSVELMSMRAVRMNREREGISKRNAWTARNLSG
jgi:hypothetical protein